jgi:hypothetical protein
VIGGKGCFRERNRVRKQELVKVSIQAISVMLTSDIVPVELAVLVRRRLLLCALAVVLSCSV